MAENSKIEWCDDTGNLWWGCTEVHEGCDNCYAAVLSNRWGNDLWGHDKPRKLINKWFTQFQGFQRMALNEGKIRLVFVGSMMDIFEKPMPMINSKKEQIGVSTGYIRAEFFSSIVPACPNLIFLLLTKRPSNINKYIPKEWKENPPSNVMFGASVVDQKSFDSVMRHMDKVNGRKFLSMEPQLGHIQILDGALKGRIDWLIQGGESGHGRRPFKLKWAEYMRIRCEMEGVPYFFKQIDKATPIPDDLLIRQFPGHYEQTQA